MVWSETKKNFKEQLGHLKLQAIISGKSDRQRLEEYNVTIRRAEKFLENLEKLNSFYDKDETIEAVLDAAVFHLTAHYNLRTAKKGQPTEEQVEGYLQAIYEAHRILVEKNQLLVKKIESPDENMYAIHGQSKIRCNALVLGAGTAAAIGGFALILSAALAAGPVGVTALAFGIVALILGSLLAFTSARSLKENYNIATGVHLEEITLFINYLDGEVSPIGNKRIYHENLPVNDVVETLRYGQ